MTHVWSWVSTGFSESLSKPLVCPSFIQQIISELAQGQAPFWGLRHCSELHRPAVFSTMAILFGCHSLNETLRSFPSLSRGRRCFLCIDFLKRYLHLPSLLPHFSITPSHCCSLSSQSHH